MALATSSTLKPSAWLEQRTIRGEATTLIDQLFYRLEAMYPQRWRAAFPSQGAIEAWRDTWADAFVDEGITPQQVADAMRACRKKYDWPPSLTEFLKLCVPPVDHESAFHEAVNQMRRRETGDDTWTHPAIYWAAVEFGSWELRGASWATARIRWVRILEAKLADRNLPEVPERRTALPAPGATLVNPEKVRQFVDELRQKMNMKAAA